MQHLKEKKLQPQFKGRTLMRNDGQYYIVGEDRRGGGGALDFQSQSRIQLTVTAWQSRDVRNG